MLITFMEYWLCCILLFNWLIEVQISKDYWTTIIEQKKEYLTRFPYRLPLGINETRSGTDLRIMESVWSEVLWNARFRSK